MDQKLFGNIPKYCILRDNGKLRRIIEFQARAYGLNKTCKESGVDYRNFNNFIRGKTKELSQSDVIKVCMVLGIKIKLDFEITNEV